MKSWKLLVLVAISLTWMNSSAQAAGEALSIGAKNPLWEIVVEEKAPDSVELAAKELQTYIARVTGVTLPIRAKRSTDKSFAIYLGDSKFVRDQGILTEKLSSDGFRILSGDTWIIIAGKDYAGSVQVGDNNPYRINETYNPNLKISAFGDTGTQQGVYQFLRKYAGIRWYMPGPLGEVVPQKDEILIPATDLEKAPAYEQRYPYFCFFSSSDNDALWYKRAGFGTPFPVEVSHSFGRLFLKYKDTHPEYFALIGGQRDFTNLSTIVGPGNLNMANPDLIEQAIKDVNEFFDQNPDRKILGLCPPDGMRKISEDPVSQSMIDLSMGEAGKFSNYVWNFINKVAAGVRKKHPDKLIGCIAYESYQLPPSNIEKMEPNVVVTICKFRRSFWDPAYVADQERLIGAWQQKASHIYAWEYYCDILFNQGWKGLPIFYPHSVKKDLMSLKGVIKGEFIEAESWTVDQYPSEANPSADKIVINYPGLQHPLLYVTGRMLWDPSEDLVSLLDEYYALFYGDAKEPMKKFWTKAEDAWMNREKGDSPAAVYNRKTLQEMLGYLSEAKEKTTPDSDYRKRVELIESEFSASALRAERLSQVKAEDVKVGSLPATHAKAAIENPAWQDATLLKLIDRNFEVANPPTHVRVGWTPDALKIAVICFEPQMNSIKAAVTAQKHESDLKVWNDDSIELFLQPQKSGKSPVYHFTVNSNGIIQDAINETNDWGGENGAWQGKATTLTRKEDGSWLTEISIPWTDLGVAKGEQGLAIKANVYRNRFATGTLEQSSWAPMVKDMYFAPEDFGKWTLSTEPEK